MAARFEILKGTGYQPYYWHLKADNGEILCHAENFASKQGAQNGINAVKRVAPNARVDDLTGESAYSRAW